MSIEIKFDSANRPEPPTLILIRHSGERVGVINNVTNITIKDNMNPLSEISFTVHKKKNGDKCNHWFGIKNFRFVYIPEWKKYFEIYISQNESEKNTKNITGIPLQVSELTNAKLFDIEINTEDDIAREDYVPTVLYNPDNPKASLLNRLLSDKLFYYKIIHVDSSIANIQRTFSFNDISTYDAFMDIAQEINCLFVFGEPSDDVPLMRTISVYDLEATCKDCGHRGEFTEVCPECGSHNIYEGYGEDTTIFLSRENFIGDISFTTDTDSVKNCFRLEAGDDLMTASVINANPSGSQYLWHLSQEDREEMSNGLNDRLTEYDERYDYYQKNYKANLNTQIISEYNSLINKYKVYDESLESIITPITGYPALMNVYYNAIDFHSYLYNSLMPSVNTSGSTAKDQCALLTVSNLSPVSVQNISYISLATANSTILSYAKVYIDTARYKIKVKDSSISGTKWTGSFTVENYYDEEDIADSNVITITFNDNYENFIKQKLDKALSNSENDDMSIVGLFKLDNTQFSLELKKYSYTYLQLILDACQSCLDILIEQGIGDKETWTYTEGNLYEEIYVPYYNKLNLINSEIIIRENEIAIIAGTIDEYGDTKTKGLKNYIDDIRNDILSELDFQSFIGEYWIELCSFRREDTWSNKNYISDGLSNSELFKNAQDFLSAAQKDVFKSSTQQHSISTTLKSLLAVKKFEVLKQYFKVGNWVRVQVDEEIYKLRLISYDIQYDSLDNSSIEFSDVVNNSGVISDAETILKQSKSIARTYDSIKRQATQGSQSKSLLDNWSEYGLDVTNTKIIGGSDGQSYIWDNHGLLFRKYDLETGDFSPKQIRILNNIVAMTNDNWKTCKAGLGEYQFFNPKTQQMETGYGFIANQIVGGMMLSEEIGIYNQSGSLTMDTNGLNITSKTKNSSFTVNPNSDYLLTIKKGNVPVFTVTDNGELSFTGNVTAQSLTLGTNGLYESNGTTSISITPKDISILTLQKGTDKVLFFDDAGELNIKANITATALTLGQGVDIDLSNVTGLSEYVKKDTVVGSTPSQNSTGYLLSSSGSLKASNAILYNSTIYTNAGNISGFTINNGYFENCDEEKRYVGMGISTKTDAFFAGGLSYTGDDGVFRVEHNGHLHSSNFTAENCGFEIQNSTGENIMWATESGNINILDAWNEASNIVSSDLDNKIKLKINGENLEIWENQTLIITLPKGYSPALDNQGA